MDARAIIAAVRDGAGLSEGAAVWFANGLASGAVSDAQAGAFAMAVYLKGIGREGRVALTRAMRDSGKVLQWDMPGPVLDKHSTGGIGDSVSLLLAPALAACGAYVPMISGRGLGHTGGTLDKLEAIAGYRTDPGVERLREVVREVGCAIVGASGDIAPADRRLYGVRDISGTVESIDLITASILSKKLAAGLEVLVLDVKAGSGAFMKTRADAHDLARSLVDTANGAGCKTVALITDMSQPLGRSAGNALEVLEVMDVLTGARDNPDLRDVTAALGAQALLLSGLSPSVELGEADIRKALATGRAAEVFARMVAALGGPSDFAECYRDRLPAAPLVRPVLAPQAGFVGRVEAATLGDVVVRLGGGRLVGTDRVNPAVGLSALSKLGDWMEKGAPLAFVHAASEAALEGAVAAVTRAYHLQDAQPTASPLILERVG